MTRFHLSVIAASLVLVGGVAQAQVAGVDASAKAAASGYSAQPQVRVALPQAVHIINFDGVSAPSLFSQTSALASVGTIKFNGSSAFVNDGGAILNSGSNFAVTGFSAPNFLAFNCSATMSNGGKPSVPEIITFPKVVKNVSFRVGSGLAVGKSIKAFGIGPGGVQPKSITLTAALQTLSFSKPMKELLITSEDDACRFVIDDLKWSD